MKESERREGETRVEIIIIILDDEDDDGDERKIGED